MNNVRFLGVVALATSMLALGTDARAQLIVNLSTPGARALAMGGAFIGVADDATTAVTNPAGLSNLSIPEVYVEGKGSSGLTCTRCDGLSSPFLSYLSVAVPISSRVTVAALRNQNIHDDDIDESLYAGSIGALITDHLRLGVSAGLVHATFARASAANGARVIGGLQYQATDNLKIGLTGAVVTQISRSGGVLNDSRVGGGISYTPIPRLLIAADVVRYTATDEFDFAHPTTFGAGGEFVIFGGRNDRIFLRGGGCNCNPFFDGGSGTIGIGYATQRRFQTDLSYASGIKELTLSAVFRY